MKKYLIIALFLMSASAFGQAAKVTMGVHMKPADAFPIINSAIDTLNKLSDSVKLKAPIYNAHLTGLVLIEQLKLSASGVIITAITSDGTNIHFWSGLTELAAVPGSSGATWGNITGSLSSQNDLTSALNAKANLSITMTTSHAANAITGTNITNWNTAYGWGNHASAGYALNSSLANYALTSALSGYVPTSRTVNGHQLSSNVTITASDVSAVAIADSANMLGHYIHRTDTASMLSKYETKVNVAKKVNIADTSAMLSHYIHRADTASMLNHYIGRKDTALMLNHYIDRADTASMLAKYLRKNGIDHLGFVGGQIAFYNSNGDTIPPYVPYANRAGVTDLVTAAPSGLTADTLVVFHNGHLYYMTNGMANYPNYYVSNSGNDSNDGLTPATAWLTVAKVNGSTLQPGTRVNFNKGNIWRETLTVPSSGSVANPIVFGSYGTGAQPIIQPTTQVTSWTQVGSTGVWYGTLTTAPSQVFISDVYCQPAHWPTAVGNSTPTFGYPTANSGNATHLTDAGLAGRTEAEMVGTQVNIYTTGFTQKQVAVSAFDISTHILTTATMSHNPETTDRYYITAPAGTGIPYSNKAWMMTSNTWFYDADAQKLYVYKTGGGNPGTIEASTGTNAIYSTDKSYFTIDGINTRYARDAGMYFTGNSVAVNSITVQNCTVNYNGLYGIYSDRVITNPTLTTLNINNNIIDHNKYQGVITINVDALSVSSNTITYSGGLYPQLPGGMGSGVCAAVYINNDAVGFLVHANTINYVSQNGIYFNCGIGTISNNTISNTSIYLTDSGGIYAAGITGGTETVTYNTFTSTGIGIYFDSNSDGGTIEHNTVNQSIGGIGLGNPTNITIRYNRFNGPFTTTGGIINIYAAIAATGNVIAYNIIDGSDKSTKGIRLNETAGAVNSLIDVENNLIMNCSIGLEEYNWQSAVFNHVENNLFYNNTTHVDAGTTGSIVHLDYNLYYGTGDWIWSGVNKSTYSDWKTASSADSHGLNVDPKFVSSSDFRLQLGSPCLNAGVDVGQIVDFAGNLIVGLPDIGAYEGAVGYLAQYQAVYNAMSVKPTSNIASAQNVMVSALVAGGYWARMDLLDVLANVSNSGGEAFLNWINPTLFKATDATSTTFTAYQGFTFNGTSNYLNTTYVPATNATNISKNSVTLATWNLTNVEGLFATIGGESDDYNGLYMCPRTSNTDIAWAAMNDYSGEYIGSTNSTSVGLSLVTRRASNDIEFYQNAVSKGNDATASYALLATNSLYIGARNNHATPSEFFPGTISIVFVMDAVSDAEVTAIYNIFSTYMTAIGN